MQLKIEQISVKKLIPNQKNARTHSNKQIRQIVDSIQAFGFANPVLIDETDTLIAGHGRLEAAKQLGLEDVPAIRISQLSDAEKRALMLADNKIALNAGWDLEILAYELTSLSELSLDFSLEVTGFEVPEIDLLMSDPDTGSSPEPEAAPEPDPTLPQISQIGDLWQLGNHRILCGDARDPRSYQKLMGDKMAAMGFADPPYNVPIDGHVCGGGRVKHREFPQASGEMSPEEFTGFLADVFTQAADYSKNGAVWFTCMDWRHIREMETAGREAFDEYLNLCVWAKTNGGMGSLYRSQHELVFVYRKGRAQHRNNVQLGRYGRNRTNLWAYPGVNTFHAGRMEELRVHPTTKPVAMIKDAILDVSARGDIVLDPFLGAGATLIAAEQVGRVAYGLELDPTYVDTALRRWRQETGQEPVRGSDGRGLSELEAELTREAAQ